jgi:hypothetical protein
MLSRLDVGHSEHATGRCLDENKEWNENLVFFAEKQY